MVRETNYRIIKVTENESAETEESKQNNKTIAVPYTWSTGNILLLILIILLSGICAYFVSQSVISVWFCVEMGLCYITLLGAAIVDGKLKQIPNILSFFLLIAGFVMLILQSFFIEQPLIYVISSLIACFLSFVLLVLAGKLSKGGVGMGDVKLLCTIGLTTGLQVVFSTMLIALIYCAIVMLFFKAMIFFNLFKEEQFQGHLPFAPFLYFGFVTMTLLTLY